MGMTSQQGQSLPWGSERVKRELQSLGQSVLGALEGASGKAGGGPSSAIAPPIPQGQESEHRVWVPIELTDSIPWEAATEESGTAIFCDSRFSIASRRRNWYPHDELPIHAPPPKILVASSMPLKNLLSANIELQRLAIDRTISQPGRKRLLELDWFTHHDLTVIRDRLIDGRYTGLHIVAHGLPGKILWFDEDSRPVWYDSRKFMSSLTDVPLTLAIWMVCHSGSGGSGGPSFVEGQPRECGRFFRGHAIRH